MTYQVLLTFRVNPSCSSNVVTRQAYTRRVMGSIMDKVPGWSRVHLGREI